ncbi:MAG: helix-turn-helix domain-containing protein [Candidatus Eisenbacteria sp.]|nr:helix-turn-helix domain-containing protein [Candidatus Eisenbacteria bacterium]
MKRAVTETTILTDSQVRTLAKQLRGFLAQSFPGIDSSGHDPETSIRMMALSAKCKEAREKRALSIKDVAAQLRVPQYRIKAIEKPSMRELKPDYLKAFVEFLGLKRWVRRWVAANAELAERLGIHDI